MIRHEDEGCCETTLSDSDNSSESSNVSQLAGFIEDPDSSEIVESGAEGTGKGGANGSFIGIGEPNALGIYCGFCEVCRALICRSGRGG